mgnify:CR=1 FL=1
MTTIGDYAFYYCSGLNNIKSKITEPQNVEYGGNFVFSNVPTSANIYVPVGTGDLYRATSPWSRFTNIIELVDGDVNVDGAVTSTDVTSLYNYLLNGDETYLDTGDVDGDGSITAADITAIYNVILGN